MDFNQENLEEMYSYKASKEYVLNVLLSEPEYLSIIVDGIELIQDWANSPSDYESKAERKETALIMDIQDTVQKIIVDVVSTRNPMTLCSMASIVGLRLGLSDSRQGITLGAELLAVLLPLGIYTIEPLGRNQQTEWYILPNIGLDEEDMLVVDRALFIPPMVERPKAVKSNRDSPYKILKGESLILGGQHKHHEGGISLDVLNIQNKVPLAIDYQFMEDVPEEYKPNIDKLRIGCETAYQLNKKLEADALNFDIYKTQQEHLMEMFKLNGVDTIYFAHKVDNRGRVYSVGHHSNYMGSSYKKAMLKHSKPKKIAIPKGFFRE